MRMNKFLSLAVAAALLFVPVAASAQVLRPLDSGKSDQDFGTIFYNGLPPTVTGTGTPSIASGSSNTAGVVTAGASATSVVITFRVPIPTTAPFCVVQTQTGGIASFAYAVTTTAITVTQSATSGNLINYHCDPSAGP